MTPFSFIQFVYRGYNLPNAETDFRYASLLEFIVPSAHAQSSNQPIQKCLDTFAPVSPDATDPLIAESERLLDMVLECYVKRQVEEARLRYETAEGIFEKSVTLVNRELYEATYSMLKLQKSQVIAFANCIDAAITGSNTSAVGATCDVITSFLAIGDLRDILIQAWHYNIGDEKKYDPLVANLAAIGLLADGVSLTGVGTAPGIIANAFVAAAKPIAKTLRFVGDSGIRAAKLIGEKLGVIVRDPNLSFGQKIDSLKLMLPFIEVSSSLVFVYQSEPRLFNFLADTITSSGSLDNLIRWFGRYIARLESELGIAAAQNENRVLDFFFPTANAALNQRVQSAFLDELRKFLDDIPNLKESPTSDEIAEAFNASLEKFFKSLDEGNFSFSDVVDEMLVLRAFRTMHMIGGPELIERLAKQNGYRLGIEFTSEQLLKAVAEFPYAKLVEEMGEEAARKGISRIVNQFDNAGAGINFSKGAIAHFLYIADLMASLNPRVIIRKIEEVVDGADLGASGKLASRRIDIQVEIDGKLIDLDVKNYLSTTWKKNLADLMNFKAATKQSGEEAGALFNDIVAFQKNGISKRYAFTPDCKATPDEILNFIEKELTTGKRAKEFMQAIAGEVVEQDEWVKIVDQIIDKMDSEKFIIVANFSNLLR